MSSPKKGFDRVPKASESDKAGLPFEPAQTRKKPAKAIATPAQPVKAAPAKATTAKSPRKVSAQTTDGIPTIVSDRMVRRMAIFCGVPTVLGILTFIVSYIIVSQHLFKLPNVVVLLVSMGCLGLGVLGLTYGVLSASWDEERIGTLLGQDEFVTNFGRMRESWKATQAARKSGS